MNQHQWKWKLINEREKKIANEIEETTTPNRINPARNIRAQRTRGLSSTPKKSLKEGQKRIKKVRIKGL